MTVKSYRFLLIIVFFLLFFLPAFSQGERIVIADTILNNNTIASPRILFEEYEHDFGSFSYTEDSVKTHVFTFKNTGGKDLVILHVATGCGCTTPVYSKQPLKPGATGTVTVTYNGERKLPGYFRKSVTVYSNDPRSYVRIFIKGELIP